MYFPIKLSIILFALIFVSQAFATTITVDNKVNSAAMYTNLQTAIDNANSTDTILVAGSPTTYGTITINKELVLIGNGYRIDSDFDYSTIVGQVVFNDDTHPDDPSNSYLSGFYFNTTMYLYYGFDILIERCQINNVVFDNGNVSGTLRNIILNGYLYMYPDVDESVVVQNSIILNGVYNTNSTSQLEIDHCMFLNGSFQYSDIQHILVRNSIIYGVSAAGGLDVTFSNNLCYIDGSTTTFEVSGTGPNYGGSNQENVDPMFTDIQSVNFSHNNDYTIQGGSPALTAADDGGEIGIFGGTYAFPSGGLAGSGYALSPQPTTPLITGMNIENPSVAENGTLNVNIQATKKD